MKTLIGDTGLEYKDKSIEELNTEIEALFLDRERISSAFENNKEDDLLEFLANTLKKTLPDKDVDPLGFTNVIKFLSESKKPLIAHNSFLDLMFLYDKFFSPLPEDSNEYKLKMN